MAFKFEKLDVWQRAMDYTDVIDGITQRLPTTERYNLVDQMNRAVTSIALNIAEGAIGQSDAEQSRFLGYAQRSLVETVACLHLVHRRRHLADHAPLREAYVQAERLFRQLVAFRASLGAAPTGVYEEVVDYDLPPPF
ncbi:MAG TPA: four helix bundle protein [Rubricoccaceae bacterium]|jgi:four helix bundle protein|nr:four helix bundle protein [Rubricoccaceae bacterium]